MPQAQQVLGREWTLALSEEQVCPASAGSEFLPLWGWEERPLPCLKAPSLPLTAASRWRDSFEGQNEESEKGGTQGLGTPQPVCVTWEPCAGPELERVCLNLFN